MDALRPGETGCLRAGRYAVNLGLRFNRGGRPGAPVTLRSYPGERATLLGGPIEVLHGSDYVTLANLNIDTAPTTENGVQIMGRNTVLAGNNITNHNQHNSCIILGSDSGWGQAENTVIKGNVIHQCGSPANVYEDHGIYVDNVVNAVITDNIIWGSAAWGIQLYPNAQGARVTHNVIDGNGLGVVFGGNGSYASSNNTVAYNVITNSSVRYNIQYWWDSAVGTGNLAKRNCVYNGATGNIVSPTTGFTAVDNLVVDPRYVNGAKHDYRLRARSRCRRLVGYDTARLLSLR